MAALPHCVGTAPARWHHHKVEEEEVGTEAVLSFPLSHRLLQASEEAPQEECWTTGDMEELDRV